MEILFLLRKNKRNPYKSATVYCRLTVDGKRANADFSTFVKVDPDEWNPKAQKIISKKSGTEQDNDTLDNIRNSLKDIFNDFIRRQRPVTAQAIKMEYLQSTKPGFSFLQIFKQLIERKRAKKLAAGTVRHNESKFRNVERFLQAINRVDLLPGEFTLKMADDFDYFLRTTLPSCSHNHVMKHLQLIKQVLKYAARQGFIIHHPLQYLDMAYEQPKLPVYLSTEELQALENYAFSSASLQKTADIYLFQCYTGFAYIDYMTFHPDLHIQKDAHIEFIYKDRIKSRETAIVPFFDKAKAILSKYHGQLPKFTNQVYNRFLKEVASLLNIKKKLTTHTARKTAAMQWLNAGVPEETVARMLGHNSTKQLKIYARVQLAKILQDTKVLTEKGKSGN